MKIKAIVKDVLIIWLAIAWALWFIRVGLGFEIGEPNTAIAFTEAAIAGIIAILGIWWLIQDSSRRDRRLGSVPRENDRRR
ncbi:hypothetical protein ES706_05250 [subsurface metagenome]